MSKISMKQPTKSISLQQAFDGFIRKCKLRNLSDETIVFYEDSYKCLCRVILPDDAVTSFSDDIIEKLIWLCKESMKETSVNTYLRGIRTFSNYCMRLGYIQPFKITLLKTDDSIKETYTNDELIILLEKPIIKKCGFPELRTWLAINILVGTGCRIGSLIELKIKDLLFDDMMIKFTKTKGRKQLLIPMSKTLCDYLQLYLQYRKGEDDDYVICDQWGNRILKNGLAQAIKKYNHKRGVIKTSCHLFRHSFAKIWIQNNGDIFRLQRILGHEDIKVTQEYLKDFGNKDLQDSFDKFNALESITKSQTKNSVSMKK